MEVRSRRSTPPADETVRQGGRPGRRATALATLVFTTALTPPAVAGSSRSGTPRATPPKPTAQVRTATPRLTGRIDPERLGAHLEIHPGRAAAALRAVDAGDPSIDPVGALAAELRLPVAAVGLALAAASRH